MQDGIIEQKNPEYLTSKWGVAAPRFNKRVIVIAGPTAVGKSRLSLEIAKLIDGEIISADSVQVYRGLDIGTAKLSLEERMQVPHHLVDICDLVDTFNVMRFYECAHRAIREILQRDRIPIVVGGTGFYLHSLLYGPPQGPPASPDIRRMLEEDLAKFGLEALFSRLQRYDADYAQTINQGDKNKIIRALEIIALTEKKVTDFRKPQSDSASQEFDFRCWFVYFPMEILYPRIEMRCDEMIARGLINEVEKLQQSLCNNPTAARAIGYRQCLHFLHTKRSDADWEQFIWEFKKASRRYAKRQFTWFRREPFFRWVDIDAHGYQKVLELILRDYESRY